jgi:hypothetical protein
MGGCISTCCSKREKVDFESEILQELGLSKSTKINGVKVLDFNQAVPQTEKKKHDAEF